METIRVNMTPCEDVQSIHASQNDNEAREWGFELHNNGEKIDSSSISDQLVFKAYEGGTEEILPTNGSTPTTSPFKGDIRYPQGLLSDQEFLYRESPTEEDGLAKITDIKGNTLVWNQLVQNGNFADTSNWTYLNGVSSISASNNTCTVNFNGSNQYNKQIEQNSIQFLSGHTYLFFATVKSNVADYQQARFRYSGNASEWFACSVETTITLKFVCTSSGSGFAVGFDNGLYSGTATVKNVMIIDLTQMGLDITASDFASLFSLPYYAYNQGTLLSFNGNGIKTVGKNRFNKDTITLNSRIAEDGQIYSSSASDLTDYIDVGAFDSVNFSWDYSSLSSSDSRAYVKFDMNKNVVGFATYSPTSKSVNIDTSSYHYLRITLDKGMEDVQVENGQKTSYEPYASSTLSLPISTYFSNGMKSAGSVYDELTETKAITRIGMVDLGSLTWTRRAINEGYAFVSSQIDNMIPTGNVNTANVLCPSYTLYMTSNGYYMPNDKTYRVGGSYFGTRRVIIRDDSYTDATAFTQAMSGIYLYYELGTYEETSFTTASLVTENTEIPLSNEDGVLVGKCTEQLSSESGFFDAKIKLADEDGECYSNKIQLHIERKPS